MDILGHLGIFDYSNSRSEVIKHLSLAPKGTNKYFIENNCLRIALRFGNPVQSLTKTMNRRLPCDIGFNPNARELQTIQLMPIRITYHALEQYHLRADEAWPSIESLVKMQENIGVDSMIGVDNQFNPRDIPNFFHPLGSGGFIGMNKASNQLKIKSMDYTIVNQHWDKFQNKWLGEYVPEANQLIIKTYIGPDEISKEHATFTQIDWYKNIFHYANADKKWKDFLDRIDA
jgi:hypothetical protein